MLPPYYILINDTDERHIKYYHDAHFQSVDYEGEVDTRHYAKAIYIKGKACYFGPRRMKHIETAIKFRNKIANIKKLDQSKFKIVLVECTLEETLRKIERQRIKPFTFEGVFK